MERVKEKRSLAVFQLPDPCAEDWDAMTPTGQGRRHCDTCAHEVFDLSYLSHAEIRALVFERTKRVCVRFYERKDGTLVTADCTPARDRRMHRLAHQALRPATWLVRVSIAALAALGVLRTTQAKPAPSFFSMEPVVEETAKFRVQTPEPIFEEGDYSTFMGLMVAPVEEE